MIKLDLSKAYNWLSWKFLSNILEAYGFDQHCINWISTKFSSHVFSILLNDSSTRTFNASCGLCQGNPISPFLYILDAKGLRRYLKEEARASHIRGLRLLGNDLPITHQ